ncbi:MAG: hypothetical protein EXR72_00430 [Myxococcales bacterium]|nr:hypothetical protein [Myxococcales bacterium]
MPKPKLRPVRSRPTAPSASGNFGGGGGDGGGGGGGATGWSPTGTRGAPRAASMAATTSTTASRTRFMVAASTCPPGSGWARRRTAAPSASWMATSSAGVRPFPRWISPKITTCAPSSSAIPAISALPRAPNFAAATRTGASGTRITVARSTRSISLCTRRACAPSKGSTAARIPCAWALPASAKASSAPVAAHRHRNGRPPIRPCIAVAAVG